MNIYDHMRWVETEGEEGAQLYAYGETALECSLDFFPMGASVFNFFSWINCSSRFSYYSGSVIHDCFAANTDFSDSRLDGCQIVGLVATGCNFDRCDFRESEITYLQFDKECTFKGIIPDGDFFVEIADGVVIANESVILDGKVFLFENLDFTESLLLQKHQKTIESFFDERSRFED